MRYYKHGQTYDRRHIIYRIENKRRVNFALMVLLTVAALASAANASAGVFQ